MLCCSSALHSAAASSYDNPKFHASLRHIYYLGNSSDMCNASYDLTALESNDISQDDDLDTSFFSAKVKSTFPKTEFQVPTFNIYASRGYNPPGFGKIYFSNLPKYLLQQQIRIWFLLKIIVPNYLKSARFLNGTFQISFNHHYFGLLQLIICKAAAHLYLNEKKSTAHWRFRLDGFIQLPFQKWAKRTTA